MQTPSLHGNDELHLYEGTQTSPTRSEHFFGLIPPPGPPVKALPVDAPQQYDPRIAYLAAVVSAWAYADARTMAMQLPYYGLPNCTVREFQVVNDARLVVSAAYFVRSEDGRVGVLAFRGTRPNDFINWLTDANTRLINFQYGKEHAGFFANVEPIWGAIACAIDDAIDPRRNANGGGGEAPLENLYITGHSLGAA